MTLGKKVIRTMLENKSRYFGSIALLAVSSMMFIMLNMTSRNIDSTFTAFSENNALSDAEFATEKPVDQDAIAAQFGADVEEGGTADCTIGPETTLRIFAMMDRVNIPEARSGSLPGPGEVMLDDLFAGTHGYRAGDAITIEGREYIVSGTCWLPNYIYIIKSKEDMMNDPHNFGIGIMGKQDFGTLSEAIPVYAVRFHNRDQIKSQEAAVKNAIRSEEIKITNWQSTDKKVNVSYIPMEISVLGTMSAAVPTAMLLLSCILLGMMMRRMIHGESIIIGTLYAQGCRKKELLLHYLLFPLIVSLLGASVGTVLGVLLQNPVFSFMLTAFPMPRVDAPFAVWLPLIAFFVPIILLCGASFLIVSKILKIAPAELMKGSKGKDKINAVERALRSLPLTFKIKFRLREQLRSLSRTALLLLGVIVSTMLMLYGFTMKSSVDYMLGEGIRELYSFEQEYVFREKRTEEPPAGTEQFAAAYVTLTDDEDMSFYVTGILPDTEVIHMKDMSGKPLDTKRLSITAPLAKKLGLKEGDKLTVFDTENGQKHVLPIEGLIDSYAGDMVFMPLSRFNEEFGRVQGSYDGIWCQEEMSFEPGEIKSTKSLEMTVKNFGILIDQMGPMIYSLIAAAFAVGLIILYIVTGLVVEENRGTISLLKIFGYRKKEINSLILDSNTIPVVIGYLLGIPALLGTANLFFDSLTESLQLVLPVKLNPVYILVGFLVVMLTFETSKRMCRKKVAAVPMSEALKSETD